MTFTFACDVMGIKHFTKIVIKKTKKITVTDLVTVTCKNISKI